MAAVELRPYQQEAVRAVFHEWLKEGRRKTLLVLPTGTGKTICFAKIAQTCARQNDRVLILAHRGELLDQAKDKIAKSTGLPCATEKAEKSCLGASERIVVGSIQSLARESRLRRFDGDYFNDIIVDEAHHVMSDSYQKVLTHFPGARVLGVTATPDRGDMKNLGNYFESLAYEYTLPEAIRDGYLCPIRAMMVPLKIDLSRVRVQAGDFKESDIGDALDPYLEQIAMEMRRYCKGRRTVVFLPLIRTSQKFRDILEDYGFKAAEVNGNSTDRAEILKDFEGGRYDVLCNSMLLTEGWDCPAVDCIVVLRPTKIRSLYAQMVGRGTRLYPGKDHLLLLDFLWMTEKHELCHPASLLCSDTETAEHMEEIAEENAGVAMDIEDMQGQAAQDIIRQRESALARQLKETERRKAKLVDPIEFEMSIQALDLVNYVPAFGWEAEKPTEKQLGALEKFGINPDGIDSKGKASALLERLCRRADDRLATVKQIRFLQKKGFQNVSMWSMESASKMMNRIAANHWYVPYDIDPDTYAPPEVRNMGLMGLEKEAAY